MNWNHLTSEEQLENIKKESENQPVLIFKHSTRCSISATALSRFERSWSDEKAGNLKPYYLDLIAFRPISNKIANDFGVEHESPQVLIIDKGKSVYDASHYDIVFDEIAAAV
ncbi:MAG: bacillithiol system redox-active protein YtxJ [Spirosomataceae bacterium]